MATASSESRIVGRSALPGLVISVVLGVMLLTALSDLPARWTYIESILPIVTRWPNIDEQYRLVSDPAPYDLLKQADMLLPGNATVLLVTSGQDVGHREYITYHRALYFLAPRPIWWLSPAPSDGSWKSRWWIAAALDPTTIPKVAQEKEATYLLAYGVKEGLPSGEIVL
ncbi:MAG TPA: hypothetical protein VM409_02925, partial [Chloroflexia bacterium]|nr:hypothetical protein [Chloroflexia bacterium]